MYVVAISCIEVSVLSNYVAVVMAQRASSNGIDVK